MNEHYQLLDLLLSVYSMVLPFVKLQKFADNNATISDIFGRDESASGKLTIWCHGAGKTTKKNPLGTNA